MKMRKFMKIKLPENYWARPVTMQDVEPAVKLFNTCSQAVSGVDSDSVEDLSTFWPTSGLNLEEDTLMVWSQGGEPAAYVELWDVKKPHVHKFAWACVHPQHQRRGLGTALAAWAEAKARQRVALAPEGARVILTAGMPEEDAASKAFVEARGYQHSRSYFRMVIDLNPDLPEAVWPEGIQVRGMQPGEERAVFKAVTEGFRDHWGFVEEPLDEMVARRMAEIDNDPRFDPSLWYLAMDGDEIAGFSLCSSSMPEDPGMGWLNQLAVLRPWRKQGLGLALLHHTFREFYKRGKERVGLGVDATSLTGATRLYERAGMHVQKTFHNYELELRPGTELGTEVL